MTAVSAHPGPGKYSSPTWLRWSYSTLLVTSALLAVPYHALEYALVPSRKPRQSWSTTEAVLVVFLRRAGRMTEHGMQHGVRDPRDEPRSSSLKETVFRWVPRLKDDLLKGALVDDFVKPLHPIGTYIWGRKHARPDRKRRGKVGLYLHGGGYAHFSAHEESQTSKIPRRLSKMSVFREIHAVEYRMLPNPFPAALQDVAAVFAHLVDVDNVDPSDIVFIGDSAGGNLALALAMWIRDEGLYAPPSGLLLLSPWCDPANGYPPTDPPVIRPNASSDYLHDTIRARAFLVSAFLGPQLYPVTSSYISAASHGDFIDFPPTFVHYGGAERLEREIDLLVQRMREAGVKLDAMKSPDTPHDVLMMHWWDKRIREEIYGRIEAWAEGLSVAPRLISNAE